MAYAGHFFPKYLMWEIGESLIMLRVKHNDID